MELDRSALNGCHVHGQGTDIHAGFQGTIPTRDGGTTGTSLT